jgi:uncharacterized protein YqgC (DUF456 family)
MAWLYYTLLLLCFVAGLLLNILAFPGLWLMVAAYVGYALLTGWDVYVGWPSVIALILLAGIAEVIDVLGSAAGSKAAGARKRGMIGAIVGGFLGAIFLSVIPIVIVAQIFGACLGAFLGAMIMELTDKDVAHSLRVGFGAAKGRFLGILSKLAFGIVMLVIGLIAAVPIGGKRTVPGATNVPPAQMIPTAATVPTTQLGSVNSNSVGRQVVGTWVSPNRSAADEYAMDGTVLSVAWTSENGAVKSSRSIKRNWRIEDNSVAVGTYNQAGTFIRAEPARPIRTDSDGHVVAIGNWTRVTTRPTTLP